MCVLCVAFTNSRLSNVRAIYEIGMDLKGSGRGLIEVFWRHLTGGTEERPTKSSNLLNTEPAAISIQALDELKYRSVR